MKPKSETPTSIHSQKIVKTVKKLQDSDAVKARPHWSQSESFKQITHYEALKKVGAQKPAHVVCGQ